MRAQPKASHFINGDYVEDTAGNVIECVLSGHWRGDRAAAFGHAGNSREGDCLGQGRTEGLGKDEPDRARPHPLSRFADHPASAIANSPNWKRSTPASRSRKPLWRIAPPAPTRWNSSAASRGRAQRRADPAGGRLGLYEANPARHRAGIGAWNYPQQIACWKAAPALVAGNAFIFKPYEVTPLGALKIAEIIDRGGPA